MTIKISNRVAQVKPSAMVMVDIRAGELRAQGRDIISLNFGEPDFDTPDHIKQAAVDAIWRGETKYPPMDGTTALKNAIIRKLRNENQLDYQADEIFVSNGAKQSLFNLLVSVLNPGDEVIVPAPYWMSYPEMVKIADGEPVILNCTAKTGFKVTPKMLEASINELTRALILNSPSNPTGKVYSVEEYRALAEMLHEYPRILVICDDIYEHIYWGDRPLRNLLNVAPELADRTVVVNGVSKAYAMTGWRVGYTAGPPEIIRELHKVQSQSTSGTCTIAQAAAVGALTGPQECVAEMRAEYKRRYAYVYGALNEIDGVECEDSDGAFYAFPSFQAIIDEMPDIRDDVELATWLLENAGVALVPGTAFGAPGHLRLSYATSMENLQEAMRRIRAALGM